MSANHGSGRAGTNFELAGTIGPAGRSMGGMIAQLIAAYHPAGAKPRPNHVTSGRDLPHAKPA
jgi:hypothetical protein